MQEKRYSMLIKTPVLRSIWSPGLLVKQFFFFLTSRTVYHLKYNHLYT